MVIHGMYRSTWNNAFENKIILTYTIPQYDYKSDNMNEMALTFFPPHTKPYEDSILVIVHFM